MCERWLDAVLAEYGPVTAMRWRREKDPFANPVGHALATGLPALFDAAMGEGDPPAAALAALEKIVRIRAVQDLSPSRAVGFVGRLRDALQGELVEKPDGAVTAEGLLAIERRIERLTLLAFDAYVRIREQMFRIRQDELKRSVASLLRRWHGENQEPVSDVVQLSPPPSHGMAR